MRTKSSYPAYALTIGVCGGLAFAVGGLLFPWLRQGQPGDPGGGREPAAATPECPPAQASVTASASRAPAAAAERLKLGLGAVAQASGRQTSDDVPHGPSVETEGPFERLMLDDPSAAIRLRNELASATANEADAIQGCVRKQPLPVSTYIDTVWTVRSSGDTYRVSDGRFDRVARGAVLPGPVLECLAALRFRTYSLNLPGLALPRDEDVRVPLSFLLTADQP